MNSSSQWDHRNPHQAHPLRSPREKLGGYAILPRVIDKVRMRSAGDLPKDYQANLLKKIDPQAGYYPLDGRFLEFTGLDPVALEQAILESPDDKAVLRWVERHALSHSLEERESWIQSFGKISPTERRTAHRRSTYPHLAHRPDLGNLSPFDLIDLDEGRLP